MDLLRWFRFCWAGEIAWDQAILELTPAW